MSLALLRPRSIQRTLALASSSRASSSSSSHAWSLPSSSTSSSPQSHPPQSQFERIDWKARHNRPSIQLSRADQLEMVALHRTNPDLYDVDYFLDLDHRLTRRIVRSIIQPRFARFDPREDEDEADDAVDGFRSQARAAAMEGLEGLEEGGNPFADLAEEEGPGRRDLEEERRVLQREWRERGFLDRPLPFDVAESDIDLGKLDASSGSDNRRVIHRTPPSAPAFQPLSEYPRPSTQRPTDRPYKSHTDAPRAARPHQTSSRSADPARASWTRPTSLPGSRTPPTRSLAFQQAPFPSHASPRQAFARSPSSDPVQSASSRTEPAIPSRRPALSFLKPRPTFQPLNSVSYETMSDYLIQQRELRRKERETALAQEIKGLGGSTRGRPSGSSSSKA